MTWLHPSIIPPKDVDVLIKVRLRDGGLVLHCVGQYINKHQLEVNDEFFCPGWAEYSEAHDEYFYPPGWYERNFSGDSGVGFWQLQLDGLVEAWAIIEEELKDD